MMTEMKSTLLFLYLNFICVEIKFLLKKLTILYIDWFLYRTKLLKYPFSNFFNIIWCLLKYYLLRKKYIINILFNCN